MTSEDGLALMLLHEQNLLRDIARRHNFNIDHERAIYIHKIQVGYDNVVYVDFCYSEI